MNDTSPIAFIFLQFAFGVSAGFCAVTARSVGAHDEAAVRRSLATQIVLSAALTVALTALALVLLNPMLAYQPGQVVSRTLAQNDALSVTLFSFDKGEEISTHESGGDAFVTCLDGVGRITIDGVNYELREGDSIVMPARHPHAVFGQEQFKMLLVVVF